MTRITPNLWFDTEAEEAVTFYSSVFPDSRVTRLVRHPAGSEGAEGSVVTVEFELLGRPFCAVNGGPRFPFTEAVSFAVEADDQAQADHYWAALTGLGGEPVQCGWLKDRYGVSWQVYPVELGALLNDPDPERANRATVAMLQQGRIDLAEIRAAMAAAD